MKVHLLQIPPTGLHLVGYEEPGMLDLDDPSIRPLDNVAYDVEVGVSGSSLFATGRLSVTLEMECVSCLRRFRHDLVVPDFAAQIDVTGPEVVDLTPYVREDILLVLPAHPRCDWDGKTICPGPRTDGLRTEEPAQVPSAWDALADLDLKRKKN
ncbi:MAG TPA: hypothetical protein VGD78_02055 [Chthoniobacterales bacterium]